MYTLLYLGEGAHLYIQACFFLSSKNNYGSEEIQEGGGEPLHLMRRRNIPRRLWSRLPNTHRGLPRRRPDMEGGEYCPEARLPPKQQPSGGSSYHDDHQRRQYDCLGGFSEEGLRDVARVLEGKLEEAKRKMEALGTSLPRPRRPSPARKRAKVVGETGRTRRITSPAATINGAVVVSNNFCDGTIGGELCVRGKG